MSNQTAPLYLQALVRPIRGFPPDPRARVPVLIWIMNDRSDEAQAFAKAIWGGLPGWLQEECRKCLGIQL